MGLLTMTKGEALRYNEGGAPRYDSKEEAAHIDTPMPKPLSLRGVLLLHDEAAISTMENERIT